MDLTITKLLQTEFLAFAMKAFSHLNKGRTLGTEQYLKLLAKVFASVATGESKRLVVNLPPRHFKTFLGSICLSAWVLAHNPSAKILVLTYGQELADKIAYAIRAILQSDWFKQAFRTRLSKDRAKLTDFVTTAGGGVRSLSIEGAVTGLGADLIIIDDPVEIKDCDNSRRLERVNELFDNEIKTRLDNPKKGRIVIIAHRINEEDLPGHVLKKPGWKQLKLPLIAPRARRFDLGDRIWKRKKGELLRPDAFTRRDIEGLRASSRPGFETLQQQNPGENDRLRIRAEHFPTYTRAAVPLAELPVILSVDPGQKGGPTNSFSVIQAWAIQGETYLLLDQWRDQATYGDFRPMARKFIRKYRPSLVLIEDTGQGPALKSDISPQTGMRVVMITPSKNKFDRLWKHRRIIRGKRVHLPDDAVWREEFLSEATLFPYAGSDDQMDALSQFLEWTVENPLPSKRPPMALAAGVDSQGRLLRPGSSGLFNAPFTMPKVRVRY